MLLLLFLILSISIGKSELDSGYKNNENNETWTNLKSDLNILRIKEPSYILDRYPLREINDKDHCTRSVKCVPLRNATCFGTKLPYEYTTLDLIPEKTSPLRISEQLHYLQSLKNIPKCWAAVQPFLCLLFMPKCINDTVDLPSQERCKAIMAPCRLVFNDTIWPKFIKCNDEKLFPKRCISDIREIKFNTTGKCLPPLVPTDNALAAFEGVDGCGYPCKDPLYTDEEQMQVHIFILWAASICFAFNLFTVVTFLIDWKNASKYPALIIFYINCCFLVACIGWLAQFTLSTKENLVCRKDNTLKMSEPSGESLSCVIIFILIYYPMMAAMVWFVILTYAWHMRFQALYLGKIQDRSDKKNSCFHMLAWCLPIILTVCLMSMGEIDGNYTTGICFVGYINHTVRAWFLLGPAFIVIVVGGYFLSRGLLTLIRLKIHSQKFKSEEASTNKIREAIIRMGLFSVFTFIAAILTFYYHIYDFKNSWEWKESYRNYTICMIIRKHSEDADVSECKFESRPSAAKLQLHLLSPFFAGILMSSWVWTGSSLDAWKRFFKRNFNKEADEPIKLKKHKVIAQVFAKRKSFNNNGRLSISFHNTHEDPVGLNFHLNSAASQDFSSTWAAALPKLVIRRCAIVEPSESISSNRRNSTDSHCSFSVRRVSVESRRNSYDSQIAVAINEFELKTSRVNKGKRRKKSHERSRKRSEAYKKGKKANFEKQNVGNVMPLIRKGSATSQESQLGMQILSTLSMAPSATLQVPNMKRRTASAGLDEQSLPPSIQAFLFNNSSDSEDNSSSDEMKNKKSSTIDIEAGNRTVTDNNVSENEESQAEEDSKILKTEKKGEIRSIINNDHSIDIPDEESKFLIKDDPILKHLLKEPNDKENVDNKQVNNLTSSLTNQNNAREIATQTSLPIELLEMEELKQSIDEIINNRNCSSKGTQISPSLKKIRKLSKKN